MEPETVEAPREWTWQERVAFEREDLAGKLGRLEQFIAGPPAGASVFNALPIAERERLVRQEATMRNYLSILDERIAADFK